MIVRLSSSYTCHEYFIENFFLKTSFIELVNELIEMNVEILLLDFIGITKHFFSRYW